MLEYHKIQSIFKRDKKTNKFIMGDYSRPEFEYLKDCQWFFEEKIDGQNISIVWDLNTIEIHGRTTKADLHKDLIGELKYLFPIEKFKELYPETPMILFGEGYGAGIQKAGVNYSPKKSFILFDVNINGFWLTRENVVNIGEKLGVGIVPFLGSGTLDLAISIVSFGLKSVCGNFYAEGIVARPSVELYTKNGQRIIVKIKHVDLFGG